jgi:hypothetical protein
MTDSAGPGPRVALVHSLPHHPSPPSPTPLPSGGVPMLKMEEG